MLYFDGMAGLFFLGLWIFCFIDVLLTPDTACRNLPKLAWVFIVLLLPDIGSIAWLVAGHPWNRSAAAVRPGPTSRATESDRPNRYVPTNPDDDEEFLAGLRKRAEDQRRRARETQERKSDPPEPS
jgi:phospholipase D-like protein